MAAIHQDTLFYHWLRTLFLFKTEKTITLMSSYFKWCYFRTNCQTFICARNNYFKRQFETYIIFKMHLNQLGSHGKTGTIVANWATWVIFIKFCYDGNQNHGNYLTTNVKNNRVTKETVFLTVLKLTIVGKKFGFL